MPKIRIYLFDSVSADEPSAAFKQFEAEAKHIDPAVKCLTKKGVEEGTDFVALFAKALNIEQVMVLITKAKLEEENCSVAAKNGKVVFTYQSAEKFATE